MTRLAALTRRREVLLKSEGSAGRTEKGGQRYNKQDGMGPLPSLPGGCNGAKPPLWRADGEVQCNNNRHVCAVNGS